MGKVELLSPAGDLDRLKIALLYGADAVYIGGQEYSLRANATNFSIEDIKEGCEFAHKLGKFVYLTLNIVFHNEDLVGVYDYIDEVVNAGIDAFIISDPFVITYIKKKYPKVELHVSTQNSTMNIESVKFFKRQGVKRVVLARELSVLEIKEIIDETKVDIEVFIHGAMCTFFSGRCALSNHFTNRDSNRGGCSQVCRFAFDIDSGNAAKFTMATKDLNTSHYIKDLIQIGVKSFKVEGRMRSHYYLATVIGSYRKLIDMVEKTGEISDELIISQERVLSRVANRETSTHYLFHEADMTDQYYTGRQELSNQDYLAYIISYDNNEGIATMSERNFFLPGEEVEIFMPSGRVEEFKVEEIYDENMNLLECARHPQQILKIKVPFIIEESSMMRKK